MLLIISTHLILIPIDAFALQPQMPLEISLLGERRSAVRAHEREVCPFHGARMAVFPQLAVRFEPPLAVLAGETKFLVTHGFLFRYFFGGFNLGRTHLGRRRRLGFVKFALLQRNVFHLVVRRLRMVGFIFLDLRFYLN